MLNSKEVLRESYSEGIAEKTTEEFKFLKEQRASGGFSFS